MGGAVRRALAYLLLFAACIACAPACARGGSSVILFETKKYVSFFDAPVAGKSALASDSEGRVRWQTLEPYVSAMIFDGSEAAAFEFEGGKWRRAGMPASRAVAEVMAGLKGAVSGGEISEKFFSVSKTSGDSYTLVPKNPAIARAVKSITVKFAAGSREPELVAIFDPSGDRTEMRVAKRADGDFDISAAFDASDPSAFDPKTFLEKK